MSECREEKLNKKILIMGNNADGLYFFRGKLIEKLLEQGHEVYISDPDGESIEKLVAMGCHFIDTPIDRRGINPRTDFKLLLAYYRMLKRIKPDMVITYTIKPNTYGGLMCRMCKVPYAINVTGLGTTFQKEGFLKKFVIWLYKIAVKKAKVIFFENEGNKQDFLNMHICKKEQAYLLNGAGVDLDRFQYLEYPKEEQVHFLFIGRVMQEKGIDELFAVMQRLHDEGENCVLDVLGYFEENYDAIIRQGQESGWLNYHGYQSDVIPFIQQAHCFVLPSWHEGMANTNLECAASGRPIITSNISGCKEAVVDKLSGFLCEVKNLESLYNAMKMFLVLSNEQREIMGKAGRLHMESVFDKNKVVKNTIDGLERKK